MEEKLLKRPVGRIRTSIIRDRKIHPPGLDDVAVVVNQRQIGQHVPHGRPAHAVLRAVDPRIGHDAAHVPSVSADGPAVSSVSFVLVSPLI